MMRVKIMKSSRLLSAGFGLVLCFSLLLLTTKAIAAPNTYGITNTRHNLLVPYAPGMAVGFYYNNYGEVCVYCHTPHGGSSTNAPLWNRALPTGVYTPYSSSTIDTNGGIIPQPDGVSLACLSCHDGTIAVDAIRNAPGSGSAWTGPVAPNHYALNPAGGVGSCLLCHNQDTFVGGNFTVAAFGQDLSNQHPISMNYPTATQDPGFTPLGISPWLQNGRIAWFDEGNPSRADDNEIKLYSDGAGGYKVQCATCHNPHGTLDPSSIGWVSLYPTFLRKSNSSSALCTTCHIK
ncbi:MAG: cytochrome c3 family protein [Nitrospirota bacterium]